MELDVLDRRIAHALQVDGRGSYARIGAVLGVSDQTVARRYARLRASRALRVVGLTEPDVIGEMQWFVRVRATPEAAQAIAAALARRTDTSWVMLLGGGTEIVCTVRTGHTAAGFTADADLLLSALPRTARVLDVQAHCRLHQFFGGRHGAVEKLGALDPDEVEALLDGSPAGEAGNPSSAPALLDELDRSLIDELAVDGRCSIERLAAATSTPAATVRRRVSTLQERGALYFDVEVDNRLLGRQVEAVLWLKVTPNALHAVGSALADHPEIAFAAACTGPFPLFAYAANPDPAALYAYLTSSVAALDGVSEVESSPVIRLLKGPGQTRVP